MSTFAYVPAQARTVVEASPTTIVINSVPVRARRATLFGAFDNGSRVGVFDHGRQEWVSGRIVGITCESGYAEGTKPHMFNVNILANGENREVFVRTAR